MGFGTGCCTTAEEGKDLPYAKKRGGNKVKIIETESEVGERKRASTSE